MKADMKTVMVNKIIELYTTARRHSLPGIGFPSFLNNDHKLISFTTILVLQTLLILLQDIPRFLK